MIWAYVNKNQKTKVLRKIYKNESISRNSQGLDFMGPVAYFCSSRTCYSMASWLKSFLFIVLSSNLTKSPNKNWWLVKGKCTCCTMKILFWVYFFRQTALAFYVLLLFSDLWWSLYISFELISKLSRSPNYSFSWGLNQSLKHPPKGSLFLAQLYCNILINVMGPQHNFLAQFHPERLQTISSNPTQLQLILILLGLSSNFWG